MSLDTLNEKKPVRKSPILYESYAWNYIVLMKKNSCRMLRSPWHFVRVEKPLWYCERPRFVMGGATDWLYIYNVGQFLCCNTFSKGPFKYYVIIFLTFLGPPTQLFDDLQYFKSSRIAIFWPHPPTSLMT